MRAAWSISGSHVDDQRPDWAREAAADWLVKHPARSDDSQLCSWTSTESSEAAAKWRLSRRWPEACHSSCRKLLKERRRSKNFSAFGTQGFLPDLWQLLGYVGVSRFCFQPPTFLWNSWIGLLGAPSSWFAFNNSCDTFVWFCLTVWLVMSFNGWGWWMIKVVTFHYSHSLRILPADFGISLT